MLMAADVAAEYTRVNGWKKLSSARDLLDDIEQFMISRGLEKSSINRYDIAQYVIELQREPVPTPEQAAWQNDQAQGIGDPDLFRQADELAMRQADERVLANQVAGMSMAEYGASRARFGLQRSVSDFLQGR